MVRLEGKKRVLVGELEEGQMVGSWSGKDAEMARFGGSIRSTIVGSLASILGKVFSIVFLALQINSAHAAYRPGFFNPFAPSSQLVFNKTLYTNTFVNDYNVSFFWNVSASTNELFGAFLLTKGSQMPALKRSWVGIGFGSGMLDAQFIICHSNSDPAVTAPGANSSILVNEHYSQGTYSPPYHTSDAGHQEIVNPITGQATSTYQLCLFSRSLKGGDGFHIDIDPSKPINMIWAFNPSSGTNYLNQYFTFHSPSQRGAVSITLNTGVATVASVQSFNVKVVHGYGMIFFWGICIPFGVYWSRFFKSIPRWVRTKAVIQSLGVCGILSMIAVVVSSGAQFQNSHAFLGVAVLCLVGVQLGFGVGVYLSFKKEQLEPYRKVIKWTHIVLGYSVLALAVTQIALGINILYPWIEPRDMSAWILYFFLTSFWIVLFTATWLFFNFKIVRKDAGYDPVISSDILNRFNAQADRLHEKQEGGSRIKAFARQNSLFRKSFITSKEKEKARLPVFTWKSIDEAITKDGRMLVVGNGKYVYDISQWIHSHPGGQIILQTVNGTDISNDYFHESGFDCGEFSKSKEERKEVEARQERGHSTSTTVDFGALSQGGLSRADMVQFHKQGPAGFDQATTLPPSITSKDWKVILRARRTHVHSRLALQRLASLVVGEMENTAAAASSASSDTLLERGFDEFEYRRYALTSSVVESAPNASRKVVRLRFCLLYPFDSRGGQPEFFQPGQAVEIQVRTSSGERISRYYTPVSGDMSGFEVLIRFQNGGKMSEYLERTGGNPGDRQFKIRGPFGNNFLKMPGAGFGYNSYELCDYEKIYFFGGGSGVTPALQIMHSLYLAKNQRLQVVMPYSATLSDELDVEVGDVVVVFVQYLDGWCYGMNLRTNASGAFPLACACPVSLTKMCLFAICELSADAMGHDTIQGVKLAYPALLEVEKYNSITLTAEKVRQVLDVGESAHAENALVIVCGPTGMTSRVTDMLQGFGEAWTRNLKILSSETPN